MTKKNTVMIYMIPAYGHVYSMLYLLEALTAKGYRVICYSVKRFRPVLESSGCEFRSYCLCLDKLDLSDGKKLLKLYRIILEYTWAMLEELLGEAKKEEPVCVIYDSLALWGRVISKVIDCPGISFYSIAGIDRLCSPAGWAYTQGFSLTFFRYVLELPKALGYQCLHRIKYRISALGLIHVLMNKGDMNIMGYSREFQPGGERFDSSYLFMGPGDCYRKEDAANEFSYPKDRLIYISLGTIFNQDSEFFRAVLDQFGGTEFNLILIGDQGQTGDCKIPGNIIIRPFVNQREILKHAGLFITSGGLNGIHEALLYGVPCLIYPQQGEQELNGRRFEAAGFGRCLEKPDTMLEEAKALMRDGKKSWDREKQKRMTSIHIEEFWTSFEKLLGEEE